MMPYQQGEEEARLRQRLRKQAVDLAVQGRWEEAEMINKDIIERFPADVEAYNRLGRALTELGDFTRAKEAYLQTLEFAPGNVIAKKNLARLASLPESMMPSDDEQHEVLPSKTQAQRVALELFTAEMGKAAVISLCNVASKGVIAKISPGGQVWLSVKGHRLIVESESGEYLGELEPKHALRLIKLTKGGNKYAAAILSVRDNEVRVVVKEEYQHPSQVGRVSFPVKAPERLRSRIEESLLRHNAIINESETPEGNEDVEEETKYPESKEQSLPEGFSILDENNMRGELEP
jgi:Tetratricopeptide repeat.